MQWRCALWVMLAWCPAAPARGVEFPYVAFVNTADVYVRSGPGRNYYPTNKLPKGEKVEIYRHDPGGWYAIRPPRQSFSWVSARHLDPPLDGLAIVNSPRVVARVGSAFSDVRDIIQVRLDKGEKVELIESQSTQSAWCKIAPPAGEFRWIFSKFVDREIPVDVAQDEREASGDPASPDSPSGDRRERGVRLASGAREVDSQTARPTDRDATGPSDRREAAGESGPQRELDSIEVELSAMIAQEVSAWSFAEIERRAEGILKDAQTPIERGRAHVLLDKLARFNDIKQRNDAIRRAQEETAGRGGPAAGSAPRRHDDPRFDGVGRLAPVVSQKVGDPQYALVDSSNAVISFVTPAPGVNLRPFVDKYVGVNGQRGYLTELQRQHISVQRVTVLDVQRR
jgi:SH3-like domain-containing protein